MPYTPTLKDFEEIETSSNEPMLQKAARLGTKYVSKPIEDLRIPEVAGGFLQGAGSGAVSAINLPLSAIGKALDKDITLPYPNLQRFAKQDPISKGAFFGGELAGQLVPGTAAYKTASNALGSGNILSKMGAGGAAGVLTGGDDSNSSTRDRLISGLLGATLPGVSTLRSKNIGKNILSKKENLENIYKNKYNKIIESLKDAGIDKKSLRVPSSLSDKSLREELTPLWRTNRKYTQSISKFEKNPTFENAHLAQSDLNKLSYKIDKDMALAKAKGQPIESEKYEAKKLANNLRKKLQGSMQQFLINEKEPQLLKEYAKTSKGFGQDVGPLKYGDISKFDQRKISGNKLVKSLVNSEDEQLLNALKDIPGFGTRKALISSGFEPGLKKALGLLGTGAALGEGASLAYDMGAPGIGSILQKLIP